MKIISLQLENIRSYIEEKIHFPEGKVLLQGDIGSGKSTILLGIEFALFGILRGTLTGSTLLRHGTKKGGVTLEFKTEKHHVFIKRALKASRDSIEQDEGILIIDGVFHNLTPTELKVRILNILGYPLDLLTKSKTLIYRYTVYTPQEQMKSIVLDSTETRINILRKVFDIDKYKRVSENIQPYLRALREQERELEGYIRDAPEMFNSLKIKEKEREELLKKLVDSQMRIHEYKHYTTTIKEKRIALETARKEQQQREQQRISLLEKITHGKTHLEKLEQQEQQLQQQIVSIIIEKNVMSITDIISKKKVCEEKIWTLEEERQEHFQKITVCTTHMNTSQQSYERVQQLTQCPVCEQEVRQEHKEHITFREQEKITRMKEKKLEYEQSQDYNNKKLSLLKEELKTFLEEEQLIRKQETLQQQKIRLERYHKELISTKDSFEKQLLRDKEHAATISEQFDTALEERYQKATKIFEEAKMKEHNQALLVKEYEQKTHFLTETIDTLQQSLLKKAVAKKKKELIQTHYEWLQQFFKPLMTTIEKHVMTRIYHGFNDSFEEWFDTLVGDELFSARLDDQFTPIIEQQGYETSIENLSGGERTACALSYRLALATMINKVITGIHTNDVLVLDEPTDGFSTEQLERMRDVLDKLPLQQIIIVSHEKHIESIVDTVIKVEKVNGVSQILA